MYTYDKDIVLRVNEVVSGLIPEIKMNKNIDTISNDYFKQLNSFILFAFPDKNFPILSFNKLQKSNPYYSFSMNIELKECGDSSFVCSFFSGRLIASLTMPSQDYYHSTFNIHTYKLSPFIVSLVKDDREFMNTNIEILISLVSNSYHQFVYDSLCNNSLFLHFKTNKKLNLSFVDDRILKEFKISNAISSTVNYNYSGIFNPY